MPKNDSYRSSNGDPDAQPPKVTRKRTFVGIVETFTLGEASTFTLGEATTFTLGEANNTINN